MMVVEDKVRQILAKLPSESSYLDYKREEYSKDKLADFIKDVISFLNSEESFGEDKYIIFGVTDKKQLCGLNTNFRDDNEYQDLVAKIHPKPSIRTGYLTYEGLTFGYIFISKENQERVYEVKKNHETKHISVYEGQAFIRSGTVNNIMRHNERESLYRKKVLSGKAKNDELFNAVYLKNKFEEENYINKNYAATVEFYCEDNNRTYTVGDGEFTFVLYWYVVDTDVARIKTKIG